MFIKLVLTNCDTTWEFYEFPKAACRLTLLFWKCQNLPKISSSNHPQSSKSLGCQASEQTRLPWQSATWWPCFFCFFVVCWLLQMPQWTGQKWNTSPKITKKLNFCRQKCQKRKARNKIISCCSFWSDDPIKFWFWKWVPIFPPTAFNVSTNPI